MIPSTAEAHARQVLDKALADYRGGLFEVDEGPGEAVPDIPGRDVDNPDRDKVPIGGRDSR